MKYLHHLSKGVDVTCFPSLIFSRIVSFSSKIIFFQCILFSIFLLLSTHPWCLLIFIRKGQSVTLVSSPEEQWFSTGGLFKHRPWGPTLSGSDSIGLKQGARICIFSRFAGDAHTGGLESTLWELLLWLAVFLGTSQDQYIQVFPLALIRFLKEGSSKLMLRV